MAVLFAALAVGLAARGGVADRLTAPGQGDARLTGFVGAKIGRFLDHRVRGDFAKDVVFPEARKAFEKPDDDTFFIPGKGDIEDEFRTRHWGMWKGEFWGKLMISACRVAEYEHDEKLKAFLHEEALRLIACQKPDGYLGSYVDPEYVQPLGWETQHTNTTVKGPWCWNLWCRKYTMWGLLANYRLTGNRRVLEALEKSMDQEIAMLKRLGLRPIDTGTFVGMPSSSVLKPLLLLYRETGKPDYLAFAKTIVDDFRRADGRAPNLIANAFSGLPVADWYEGPELWAKAYEMMSCLDGLLEYYRVTGEASVLEAMKRVQAMLAEHETNPCFSVGYNDQFANAARLLNGVTEPCDVIHWIRFNHDLWLITGETKYVDAIELAFYNTYLAAMFRDGTWGARAVRSHGYHFAKFGQSGMKNQHCCVNNMPRCAIDVAQTIAAKDAEGTLYVAFYNDGRATVGGDSVEISGNYPVGDTVTVKVTRKAAGRVCFRIPAWSATDADRSTWRTVEVPAGESVHTLAFDLRPRVWSPKREAVAAYPEKGPNGKPGWRMRMWTGYGSNTDLVDAARKTPGVEILRGPMLVAKAEAVGTSAEEIAATASVYGTKPSLALEPVEPKGTWGAWNLRVNGRTIPVCDFGSAGDEYKSGGVRFSVWF